MNHSKREVESLLLTDEAAVILECSVGLLERDRSTGNLGIPYVRFGRSVRYVPSDLIAWVQKHRVNAGRTIERKQVLPAEWSEQ